MISHLLLMITGFRHQVVGMPATRCRHWRNDPIVKQRPKFFTGIRKVIDKVKENTVK